MFLVNSCLGHFSATPRRGLPFFRSYGVILPSSLNTLFPLALESSSYLPVSVCGTGTADIHKAFLALVKICFPTKFRSLTPESTNARDIPIQGVTLLKSFGGYGISTVCASTTPFGLALAPDLLGADEPSPKNLRFSANMILTYFSLLIPAFSLLYSPPLLPMRLHPIQNAPLPLYLRTILSFGCMLSPVTFSAQSHSTSELLRTLLMSGCF